MAGDVVPLVGFLALMHKALGLIFRTTYIRCGGTHLKSIVEEVEVGGSEIQRHPRQSR